MRIQSWTLIKLKVLNLFREVSRHVWSEAIIVFDLNIDRKAYGGDQVILTKDILLQLWVHEYPIVYVFLYPFSIGKENKEAVGSDRSAGEMRFIFYFLLLQLPKPFQEISTLNGGPESDLLCQTRRMIIQVLFLFRLYLHFSEILKALCTSLCWI